MAKKLQNSGSQRNAVQSTLALYIASIAFQSALTDGFRIPTEVATFRMPRQRIDQLKREAKERGLNSNALMNQIVESYFEFHSVAVRTGMMPFPKSLLKEMMSQLDEKKISKLSKIAAELVIPNFVYMKRNKFTTEAFVDTLLAWSRYSEFQYRDTFEEGRETISIQHNMGPRWSKFLMETAEITFRRLGVSVSFERRNELLVVHIKNHHF